MSCEVEIILDSRNTRTGDRITTMRLRYWRAIHSEVMTHRVMSRNAGSSRAKPVAKVLSQVWNDPAGPEHWGQNRPGMQASEELHGTRLRLSKLGWKVAGRAMCVAAWALMRLGGHKQWVNRLLEPWQYIDVLVTSTEWENFFALRAHPDAQPEFKNLAETIQRAMALSVPQPLKPGQWHIPYLHSYETDYNLITRLKLATARIARVSYAPFDGRSDADAEKARHDKLKASRPIHASPFEHSAQANYSTGFVRNFAGFTQYRVFIEEDRAPIEP